MLAWRTVVHDRVRLFASTTAIAFASLIIFMELGFLNGLGDSQASPLEAFRADLVMVSSTLHILNTHETFARARLMQAAAVPGVRRVCPVYIEDRSSDLRNVVTGLTHRLRVFGFNLDDPVFESSEINGQVGRLRRPETILFDASSRRFFKPLRVGARTELAGRSVEVVGSFHLGSDYYYDGNVLAGSETFFELFPAQQPAETYLGLVQLDPGVSPGDVLPKLRAALGPDVEAMTKPALVARERATWRKVTPAGYIFTMGIVVGFVIGVFIGYQILYTEVTDHLPQLATMKALGYGDATLIRLVLTHAVLLGLLGFALAVLMSLLCYEALTDLTGIGTKLSAGRIALVLLLTLGMCFTAGMLAVRKVLSADPAELF